MVAYTKHTVLLVEDEFLIADALRDTLFGAGYDVLAVGSAEEALGFAVMDVDFDILITDIDLDGPMNGWQLARTMRDMRPALPIVYTSGSASRDEIKRRLADTLFVSKPYREDDLTEMVGRLIEEAALARVSSPSLQPALPTRRQVA